MKRAISLTVIIGVLLAALVVRADWTEQKVQDLTLEFQKYKQTWTFQDTVNILQKSQNSGTFKTLIRADSGKNVWVEIKAGRTVLLDGKDVSGNLGSKTTHGDNSPIIEDVQNSQITTGERSPIEKDVESITSFNITFTLSVALSLSVILNIALAVALRKQRAANKALHSISERPRLSETSEC